MEKMDFTKWTLTLALSGLTLFAASAADIYVSSSASDDTGDGTQDNPVLTLGRAFQLINSASGTIYVSGEIDGYTAGGSSDANGICPFPGNPYTLTIQGIAGTNPKIVGNSTNRMFYLRSDMGLVLKDLTLSGTVDDPANRDGCCVLMQGGWLEIDNVIFENFSNNNNGTVLCVTAISAAKPSIICKNTVFRNNSAGTAGYGSVMRVNDVSVTDSKFYFENCAFLNNSALYGTFFFRQATSVATNPAYTYVNCTFTGNTNTNGNSGCLTAYSALITLNVINCTIKDNPANGSVRITAAATVNVRNSILEGNTPSDLNVDGSPTVSIENSFINATRNITGYTKPAGYANANQLLSTFSTGSNCFVPKRGSLAIGYGDKQYLENLGTDGTTTVNYDQMGNPRPFADGKCDAGAVEIGSGTSVWASASGNDDNIGTQDYPVATLLKAFSLCGGTQTDTIYVNGNVAANLDVNGLDLNGGNLTVQGLEGTTAGITGDSLRLFSLRNNAVLTLKNLHLSGNPEKSLVGQGACIYINGGGGLFVENTVFENFSTAFNPDNEANPNNDTSGGGVVFLNLFNNSSVNPILSFKNCKFINNSNTGNWGGGVMRVQDFGTATVVNPWVYFENCGFYGNNTTRLGGDILFVRAGNVTTSRVTFINSTITACGTGGNGAIYPYGGANMTWDFINTTIKDNAVRGIYQGGNLNNVTYNIYNSVFEGNTTNDFFFQETAAAPGIFNINNSLIDNVYFRDLTGDAPYAKPAEYTAGDLFDALDETTISFKPKAGSLALNYGDAQYLTALNIDYDQLGNERWFKNNLCDAGAVETIKIPIFRGAGAWTETARWNTGTLPAETAEVIIDGDATVDSNITVADLTIHAEKTLTINPGQQFTVTDALVNNGALNLLSDATGTATILTPADATVTANVQQYLSTENGREWYCLASPVTGATVASFATEDKVGYYDETTTSWSNPFTETTTPLVTGTGYIVKLAATSINPTYTFSGTLNNGTVNIPVSRTGSTAPKRGFNLVGNPYPSYLDWDEVTKTNLQTTIWTRAFETGQMVFKTYNADAQVGTDNETTAHIAPLQAFWVKVPAEKADNTDLTLDLTNDQRLHKNDGDGNLRAAKAERQLLRLQVSNGTNSDNAVILFDDNADNDFDSYDSEKMNNSNPAIPEIYTLAGTETVVINSLAGTAENRELVLGFKTGTAGTFSISIETLQNIEKATLIDKLANIEFDLTTGAYEFTSEIADNAERFSIAFRAPSEVTGLQLVENQNSYVYAGVNGQITVHANNGTAQIFNIAGRKLAAQTLNSAVTVIDRKFEAGVYIVKVNGKTTKVVVK
ncbi:MAG: T9SS type A sorting domain-containing protein [Prevotellaceae bacterium]|nr:T9SS type A sorting domain-containing protein [Prevotellaceae bacterium]